MRGVAIRGIDPVMESTVSDIPKADIAANDYDLSINRYKEIIHEEVEHESPQAILDELATLEAEIQQGIHDLKAMLSS